MRFSLGGIGIVVFSVENETRLGDGVEVACFSEGSFVRVSDDFIDEVVGSFSGVVGFFLDESLVVEAVVGGL